MPTPPQCLMAAVLLSAVAAAPAQAAGTKLTGAITWTTTLTTAKDEPGGDKLTAEETRKVTLKVRMTKRPGAFGWQPEDNGSSYTGRYTLSSTGLQRDIDGATTCTTVREATGSGRGALPRKPRSTSAPALFADVVPATPSLGSRTKAIVLKPILRFKGQERTTTTGSGLSPCQSGTFTDPIDGTLAATDSAERICYPKGTSRRTATPQAATLLGAYNRRTRTFFFACSRTWTETDGSKLAVRISGSLKVR